MSQPQSEPQGAGQGAGTETGGALPAAGRSTWPLVIGIISIALASMAIICTPVSLAMQFSPAQREVLKGLPGWFNAYTTASCVLGVLMGVLLLIAGITLVMRKAAARALHLVYGGLAILACLVGLPVTALAFSTATLEGPAKAGMYVGFVCAVPLGLAYPVFLLIWFLRGAIAREMASWRDGPQG